MLIAGAFERIVMDVHAAVPDTLAVRDRPPAWVRAQRGVSAPIAFLEGPVLDGRGGLWCVDVAWGRILHVDSAGAFNVLIEYDGEPNGLVQVGPERLLIADYKRGLMAIDGIDSHSPQITTIAETCAGQPFIGLNDLIMATDGTVYATDQGDSGLHETTGRLIRYSSDGSIEEVLTGIPSPNGLVLNESEQTVYLAVTRDNAVWRVPLDGVGVHRVGRYIQLSGGIGPDGMAYGPDGLLCVAHIGTGTVWVFDHMGALIAGLIAPTGSMITNVCVDNRGRLWATEAESASILTTDLAIFSRRNGCTI